MRRKVFKTGNSVVISLPQEFLEILGIEKGEEVNIELDQSKQQLVVKAIKTPLASKGIDPQFAQQVTDFIEKYRSTLDKLANS